MPTVHHVVKARKDNPVCSRGEAYYWWKFRFGGKHFSLTRPKNSQLTQSGKLSRVYSVSEQIDGYSIGDAGDIEAAGEFLREMSEEIEEVAQEYEDSANNIRESFTESTTADECEEKCESLREWVTELEEAASDVEAIDVVDMDYDVPGEDEKPVRENFPGGKVGDQKFQVAHEEYSSEVDSQVEENAKLRTEATQEAQGYVDGASYCPI